MASLNGVRKRRLTAKETSIANCEVVLDEQYRIAVQRIFVKSTKTRKTGVLARWLFDLWWLDTVFQGQYLPSLSINYVAINKVLKKLTPQLY